MNKIYIWKPTRYIATALVTLALAMVSVTSHAELGWIGMSPQNCSPIHPRWIDSVYAHPNGMLNLGDKTIWVTCSLPRTLDNNDYAVRVGVANISEVDQEITCGLREYFGPTIAASPITQIIPAGTGIAYDWFFYEADASGISIFSAACKLPPWNGGGVILKSIWVTPDLVLPEL